MRVRWIGWVLAAAACSGPSAAPDGGIDAAATEDAARGRECERQSECDDGVYCNGVEACVDRVCVPGTAPCGPGEVCVEAMAACVPSECTGDRADRDGDMHRSEACGGDDCDDDDPNRYAGNPEHCDPDGHDEDCDPSTYGFRDADGDGDPDMRCCNDDVCGTDCDDMRPGVSSHLPEVCGNGTDDDCDGTVDEGAIAGFADPDGDGWGDDSMPLIVCPGTAGYATMGGDCDESEYSINPGAAETCNHGDEDCDGLVDEGAGATACMAGWTPDRCSFPNYRCHGHCDEISRPGYIRLGGSTTTPNTPPGAAYFADVTSPYSVDLGRRTTVSTEWSVRYLSASPGLRPAEIAVLFTPRVGIGPETPPGDVSLPSGAPTLMADEVGIVAVGIMRTGHAAVVVYGPDITDVGRVSGSSLPAACLPSSTTERTYRVTAEIDGSDITATLSAPGCGSTSVTYSYAEFWSTVYGERPDFPRYWIAALADSDDGGASLDLRRLDVTRDPGPERPGCVPCPWRVRIAVCPAG